MKTIWAKNLVKKFKDKTAVDDVTFSIGKGEVFGLLGPNGAGKTTIISMLTTLAIPTAGQAKVCGYDVVTQDLHVRKSIGLVFQETILDEDLTAYANLDTHARLYRVPPQKAKKRIRELLDLVELGDELKNKVGKFSGGMKRRLEIARGLIHQPKVLFLDEPTIGLDLKTRRMIWDYILKLRERTDITILLTTHYLEEADVLCDRVAIMRDGKIVVSGSPHDLKKDLGGDLIRIELDRQDARLEEKIRSLPYVKKVKLSGSAINLTVDDGEKRAVQLIPLVNSFPPTLKSMNLREPTLDDVFLYHTGERIATNSMLKC
ncbi:ATP-binding cassette domain-containing protein [Patescibacteria group bacterium]